MMDLLSIIHQLEAHIDTPHQGLPEEVFLMVSRLTPLVNVDLLIKNENGQTLLTWRDDGFFPAGWHIPGGIIRYKETMAERICAVAAKELGCMVDFRAEPLQFEEVIVPTLIERGHAISFLFDCNLIGEPDSRLKFLGKTPQTGEWAWHDGCPVDFMTVQGMYRKFLI